MNWIDYREKLGLSHTDKQLYSILKNKVITYLRYSEAAQDFVENDYYCFCLNTGADFYFDFEESSKRVATYIENKCTSVHDIIAYFIAFVNASEISKADKRKHINNLKAMLNDTKIPFEMYRDAEGYYLLPTGVEAYDNALVSEPLMWLEKYPITSKTFSVALKQYSDGVFVRDAADNFRKSLEEFLKEFFQNSKNLDNNIQLVGQYIKEKGGSEEISKMLVTLLNLYSMMNNKTAKHHDKFDAKFLEFLMYQTGLFIRMLIVAKKELV